MFKYLFAIVFLLVSSVASSDEIDPRRPDCVQAIIDKDGGATGKEIAACIGELANRQSDVIADLNEVSEKQDNASKLSVVDKEISDRFSEISVIAQVQAQASCVAIADNQQKYSVVRAIMRPKVTEKGRIDTSGNSTISCSNVCRKYKGSCFSSLHIYSANGPYVADKVADFTEIPQKSGKSERLLSIFPPSTLRTVVYKGGCEAPYFGPNYCCCGN